MDPSLADVNSFLQSYKAVWDELVDSWLVIQIGDPQVCGGKEREGKGRGGEGCKQSTCYQGVNCKEAQWLHVCCARCLLKISWVACLLCVVLTRAVTWMWCCCWLFRSQEVHLLCMHLDTALPACIIARQCFQIQGYLLFCI